MWCHTMCNAIAQSHSCQPIKSGEWWWIVVGPYIYRCMPLPKLTEMMVHLRPLPEADKKATKQPAKIVLVRTKEFPQPEKKTIELIKDFIQFAADFLKLGGKEIKVRLVHAAPKEAITTGAYEPGPNASPRLQRTATSLITAARLHTRWCI